MRYAFDGGEFNDIASDYSFLLSNAPQQLHRLGPEKPVRFRGSRAWHDGRIKTINIKCNVDVIGQPGKNSILP